MSVSVELAVEDPSWTVLGDLQALVERAVAAAIADAGAAVADAAELSCLFCDDETIRGLNRQWRGLDKPTNVLSFPAAGPASGHLIGDLALAFGTTAREAAEEGKPLADHVAHLVVHGTLHLLGHDHEDRAEAERMEAIEIRALRRLGIPDPYAGSVPADDGGPLMREQDQTGRAADRRAARASGAARAEAATPSLIERMRALFGLGSASIREDIEEALDDDAGEDATFTTQERAMLRNVLGLHELRVEDIMVPRADVIAVGSHMTLGEALAVFRAAGHSRLPVHGDTLDDPRGMIHIRDFVDVLADVAGAPAPAADAEGGARAVAVTLDTPIAESGVTRPVLFAPPSMQALDLLVKMQASRTHMALVIDEYGGTDGLLTIEDIVEMIVGDIEDEHDEDEAPLIAAEPDGSFVADGRASLEEVSAAVGADLGAAVEADDIDTIGGLVATLCGRLPLRGEVVEAEGGFHFEVLDADPRRIKRIRIRKAAEPAESVTRPAAEPA